MATDTDRGHAKLLWVTLQDAPNADDAVALLADSLAAARRAFAEAVAATADKDCVDEDSIARLGLLLSHEYRDGDQGGWPMFAAPTPDAGAAEGDG